jgi:exodeoxyribonuclease V alpha subunit
MESLTCKITGLVFSNRDTGFYVLKVVSQNNETNICSNHTVRGSFPGIALSPGLKTRFTGKWDDHPTYGKQFSASTCELIPEKGRIGIVTYLSSHVPSIGPITAAKLYDALGDNLIQVLEKTPDDIRNLKFLTKAQAAAIINEWQQSSHARTASIFLSDLGLNASQIKSVYDKFGTDVIDKVKGNPYCLYECNGVGFITADNAARKLGIGVDDERRIRAIIMFILIELSQNEGHMYATTNQIQDYTKKVFKRNSIESFSHGDWISDSHYFPALMSLIKDGSIISNDDKLYLSNNWMHESIASECIAKIACQEPRFFGNLRDILSEFESERDIELADEQKEAFFMLERSRICVISGYPGTGKTLLTSAFVYLFEKSRFNYVLMSPTGIAAKRLSQVTGKPASTIHRALGYGHDGAWKFNSDNKFFADAIVVDEASMLDASTLYHLVSALPSSTIIIFVGDSAQLPSVGAGYVLNNLMNCSDLPHVTLTRIYRQSKQSDIVSVAHAILRGHHVDTDFNKDSEFVFLPLKHENVIEEVCKVAKLIKDKDTNSDNKSTIVNFQVIAPMYDGELGVNNLNCKLRQDLNQEYIFGKASKIKHGDSDLYEGDRVMIIRNDYDRMIFNGDVGKVQRISLKEDIIEIKIFDWFDHEASTPSYIDKVFTYKIDEARQVLRVAYACTVHKCQGQEYDYVLMPMTMQYGIMLYRNLVYTAITRARKKVFVFGDSKAFSFAIDNNRETIRNSDLNKLISDGISLCKDIQTKTTKKYKQHRKQYA